MKTIELHDAFMFACDDCGRDNFVRAITVSPESIDGTDDADVIDELRTAFGEILEAFKSEDLIGNFGGTITARPTIVECEFCGSAFHTNDPEGEDD